MSKFGSLGVVTDQPVKMPIVLPGDVDPLVDQDGREAYIAFLPWDSDEGRKFDAAQQRDVVRKGFRQKSRAELLADAENADAVKEQAARLTALAAGWHLVDANGAALNLPFTPENAFELFTAAEMGWLRRAAWVFVVNEANFMRRSSKT